MIIGRIEREKAPEIAFRSQKMSGRGRRTWTLGTRFWRPLLYQLSYTPKYWVERVGVAWTCGTFFRARISISSNGKNVKIKMKTLLIIPGRFYRFLMVMAVSANGSPHLSSFKCISPFSADKINFSSMRLFCGWGKVFVCVGFAVFSGVKQV